MKQYLQLIEDLRRKPSPYMEWPSPLALHVFLQGYQHGDPRFCAVFASADDSIAAGHHGNLAVDCGMLLYLQYEDSAMAYAEYLSALTSAVAETPIDADEVACPAHRSMKELLPDLRVRAPMLIGSWDVRDLYIFAGGFLRALDDSGFDTTSERHSLDAFQKRLQEVTRLASRWDKILFAEDSGHGRSAAKFAEEYEKHVTSRQ